MNVEKFNEITARFADGNHIRESIGTYKEKYLHIVLKHYLCGETQKHEVKLGRFVADVLDGEQIFEVQTGSLYPLRPKIDYYLNSTDYKVCIVVPVYALKWISWLDPVSGAMACERRRSPKKENPWKIFPELFWLSEYLGCERLSLKLVSLEVEEIRILNGWSDDKKSGAEKYERIPLSLIAETDVGTTGAELRKILPPDFSGELTQKDIANKFGIGGRKLSLAVKILQKCGIITLLGKNGRKNIYSVVKK